MKKNKIFLYLIMIVLVTAFFSCKKAVQVRPDQGVITYVSGNVDIINNNNISRKAEVIGTVNINEKIKTDKDSTITIQIQNTGVIRVLENSEIIFNSIMEGGKNTSITNLQGKVFSKILEKNKDTKFIMNTEKALATTKEADFLTEYIKEETYFSLYKGIISYETKKNFKNEMMAQKGEKASISKYKFAWKFALTKEEMLQLQKWDLHPYIDKLEDKSKGDIQEIFESLKNDEKKIDEEMKKY